MSPFYEEVDMDELMLMNEYQDSLERTEGERVEEDLFTGSLEDYGLSWRDFL